MRVLSTTSAARVRSVPEPANLLVPALLLTAIAVGSLIGLGLPTVGAGLSGGTDALVVLLVALIFFEAVPSGLRRPGRHGRLIAVAWVINFVVVPLLAAGLARLFGGDRPELWLGLIIYLCAPCTDWFLGFTRLAGGNTVAGSLLLPINLVSQLLLCPIYWALLGTPGAGGPAPAALVGTMLHWFVVPLLAAIGTRVIVRALLPNRAAELVVVVVRRSVPWVIAGVIMTIFAGNIETFGSTLDLLPRVAAAVLAFFVIMIGIGEIVRRSLRLDYADHALLTMTTSARNAPLMLGLAVAAFPDRPEIPAIIATGMLLEFPHLIMITTLLRRRNRRPSPATPLTKERQP